VQADINLEASHARSDVALREVPRGGESSEQARGPALGWLRRRRALPAAAAAAIGAHVFGREEKKSGSVEPNSRKALYFSRFFYFYIFLKHF